LSVGTPKYGKIKQSKNELYEACLRCGIFLRGKPNSPKVQFWEGKGVWKRASSPPLELKRDDDIGNRGIIKLMDLGF